MITVLVFDDDRGLPRQAEPLLSNLDSVVVLRGKGASLPKIAPGPQPDVVLVSPEHLRKLGARLTRELEGRLKFCGESLLFRVDGSTAGIGVGSRLEGYAAKGALDTLLPPLAPYLVRASASATDDGDRASMISWTPPDESKRIAPRSPGGGPFRVVSDDDDDEVEVDLSEPAPPSAPSAPRRKPLPIPRLDNRAPRPKPMATGGDASYQQELARLEEAHQQEVESLQEALNAVYEDVDEQLAGLRDEHKETLRTQQQNQAEKLRSLARVHADEVERRKQAYEANIAQLAREIEQLRAQVNAKSSSVRTEELAAAYEALDVEQKE